MPIRTLKIGAAIAEPDVCREFPTGNWRRPSRIYIDNRRHSWI
jgi:hypothetical protein